MLFGLGAAFRTKQKPPLIRLTDRGRIYRGTTSIYSSPHRGEPRRARGEGSSGGGCTGRDPWGDPCMPHRCNGRTPLTPWRISRRRFASRPQLPECNSTVTSPPSRTDRRLSVRVIAAYWLPLIAFDGGIINLCQGFVKGFLKIYAVFFFFLRSFLYLFLWE